ncbi:MAG: hypothetical protein AAB152_15125 [Candidatus Coatesbacteria bacterium]
MPPPVAPGAPAPGATPRPAGPPGELRPRVQPKKAAVATPPPAWLVLAATIALAAELLLVLAVIVRAGQTVSARREARALMQAQVQADQIRRAWEELAEQGALLYARLSRLDKAAGSLKDLERGLRDAAKSAGLTVEIAEARGTKVGKSVKRGTKLVITGSGPEGRVFDFLLGVDRLNAIIHMEELQMTGTTDKGVVYLKLGIVHDELKARYRDRLKALVEQLPRVAGAAPGVGAVRRVEKLFVPMILPDEEALRGWPRITLNGFTSDKALFTVNGEEHMLSLGQTITGDIIYSDKPAVNQAILTRGHDRSAVILTVGSRDYSIAPDANNIRSMVPVMLTIQRSGINDLLKAVLQP